MSAGAITLALGMDATSGDTKHKSHIFVIFGSVFVNSDTPEVRVKKRFEPCYCFFAVTGTATKVELEQIPDQQVNTRMITV